MASTTSYQLAPLEIILIFAILQTLLLVSVLLAAPGRMPLANCLLCTFLLLLALILAEFVFVGTSITASYPQLLGISLPAYFALAPVYYLYVRALTEGALRLRAALHFTPLLAGMLAASPFYLSSTQHKYERLLQITGNGFTEFPLLPVALLSLISFQTIFYFFQSNELLERYSEKAKERSASTNIMATDWLRKLSSWFCLFVLFFYWAAADLFFFYSYRVAMFSPAILSSGIAAFIFLVSWNMYRRPELFALYTPGALPLVEFGGNETKYEKTQLRPEQQTEYEQLLLVYMEKEKPYLNGELRLAHLASALDIPAHHLSQVINVGQDRSFFDFVNGYRVKHAKQLLLDDTKESKMLVIALDSGFNSKSSFNRVFKKETGMAPSDFQNRQKNTEKEAHLAR